MEEDFGSLNLNSDEVTYVYKGNTYRLSSHPYEPCLYVWKSDAMVCALHNAYNPDQLVKAFAAGKTVRTMFGKDYDQEIDETGFCRILAAALESGRDDMDLFYAAKLAKARSLSTPFGAIQIRIDGKPVPYVAKPGRKLDAFPHVLGRYRIAVSLIPDGKAHTVACVFEPACACQTTQESGERLECQSFYNASRFKLSIGIACEAGASGPDDDDAQYLDNGMAYRVGAKTKTALYVFGIAWIDNAGWEEDGNPRGIETWLAADPSLAL